MTNETASLGRGGRWAVLVRFAELLLSTKENSAGPIYGMITCGSLLAAESVAHESLLDVAGATLVALVLYGLAHAYSLTLGARLDEGVALTPAAFARQLANSWAVVRGAFVPLLVLLLCAAAGSSEDQAVLVALLSTSVLLVVVEISVGVRSELTPKELVLPVTVSAVLGVGILALRVILV
jgi:hypothetical protein